MDKTEFAGKTVLVTGGCRGIGRAVVSEFLERGAKVVVFDILDPEFPATGAIYHRLDIRHKEQVKKLCLQYYIDILVNNAGITGGDDWDNILGVNLIGTHNVTETVIPQMRERRGGNIVFVTSVHSSVGFVGNGAYDTSKAGLVGYMRVRALELARFGIRVNAVAPGAITNTGGNNGLTPDRNQQLSTRIPLGRLGEPHEVAKLITFLSSQDASYITGTEIRVDGGMLAQNPLF